MIVAWAAQPPGLMPLQDPEVLVLISSRGRYCPNPAHWSMFMLKLWHARAWIHAHDSTLIVSAATETGFCLVDELVGGHGVSPQLAGDVVAPVQVGTGQLRLPVTYIAWS